MGVDLNFCSQSFSITVLAYSAILHSHLIQGCSSKVQTASSTLLLFDKNKTAQDYITSNTDLDSALAYVVHLVFVQPYRVIKSFLALLFVQAAAPATSYRPCTSAISSLTAPSALIRLLSRYTFDIIRVDKNGYCLSYKIEDGAVTKVKIIVPHGAPNLTN